MKNTMPLVTANLNLSQKLRWINNSRIRVESKGCCLNQYKVTFTPRNVENLFTVYELERWSQDLNAEFTLKVCLFGAFRLTINTDPDKYFTFNF